MQNDLRNPLLERNLDRLSRYGFRQSGESDEDPVAADWARLKDDFADFSGTPVPDFDDLPTAVRLAARHYVDLRREADALLTQCETAHGEILNEGLSVARVEDYAVMRDAYEDKVEEFGAARQTVAGLLTSS